MKRKKILGLILLTLIATLGFTDANPFPPTRMEVSIGNCAGPYGSCAASGLSQSENRGF